MNAAEGPPPGVRAMALFRWLLVGVMALVAVLSVTYSFGLLPGTSASASAVQYYCPMHPQVVQDHPGECPICSMTLVKREGGGERTDSHAGHRHEPSDPFICPMHPEETGVDAAARCPICGMKLEPRPVKPPSPAPKPSAQPSPVTADAPAANATAAPLPHDVPGLAPVELTLDRVQAIGVRTAVAREEELLPELATVGFVSADEARFARVHSRFSGWIDELAVAVTGQKVSRGEVLARLYNTELLPAQQEFLAARRWTEAPAPPAHDALPRLSGATLERDARARLELFGVSASEIERIAETGQPIRSVAIAAPIGGYVVTKNAVRGAFVDPGTELFEIVDLSKVWVLADVYERDAGRVRTGQAASVRIDALPNRRFDGKLGFLYPSLDPATRTLRVRIELENRKLELRPGMYGNVVIRLDTTRAVTIPSEALADTGEHQYVFLARDGGRFEPRRVRAGARVGERVEILEGVAAGDVVVSTANFLIDSESRLRAAIQGTTSP